MAMSSNIKKEMPSAMPMILKRCKSFFGFMLKWYVFKGKSKVKSKNLKVKCVNVFTVFGFDFSLLP